MPLTADAYKALILAQVGDSDPPVLAAQIDTLWAMHDGLAVGNARFYTVKLEAIDTLMGAYRKIAVDYTIQGDLAEKLQQLMTNLKLMRDLTVTALTTAQAGGSTAPAPATSTRTTVAPVDPPVGYPAGGPGLPYPPWRPQVGS